MTCLTNRCHLVEPALDNAHSAGVGDYVWFKRQATAVLLNSYAGKHVHKRFRNNLRDFAFAETSVKDHVLAELKKTRLLGKPVGRAKVCILRRALKIIEK